VSCFAEDAGPNRVKCSAPHSPGLFSQEACDTLAHFPGSFVGEREGKNPRWIDTMMLDQPRNAGSEHARLPGTRPGEYEHRPLEMEHRLALGRIEAGEGFAPLHGDGIR